MENEAYRRWRCRAADWFGLRGRHVAAGALRRSTLLSVRPAWDGAPIVWIQAFEAEAYVLRRLTWCHNGSAEPGPLDLAFAEVLQHYDQLPRIHFEVVERRSRAA